jgi:hypothetical protein
MSLNSSTRKHEKEMAISPLAVGFDYTKEDDSTPVMSLYIVELLYRVCALERARHAFEIVTLFLRVS